MKARNRCRVCFSKDLELLLDYGQMPLAGGFVPAGDPRADLVFPLQLGRCPKCTLLQTMQDIDPGLLFTQYSYSSSSSIALVSHFEQLARLLSAKLDLTGRLCIDIGSNDGILLKPLRRYRANILGVDPSDVAARAGQLHKFPVVSKYLSRDVADDIRSEFGVPRLITACNVLAHTPNPHSIVEGIARLAGSETLIVIEVHYQLALIGRLQYDTVYHEHTCYYSLEALRVLLEENGLQINGVDVIENHGGSIRVFAGKAREGRKLLSIRSLIESESRAEYQSFGERASRMKEALVQEVKYRVEQGKEIYAYGASGRGTILLNWCGFTEKEIPLVVDRSPLRFGKVVPGVKIPIRAVDEVSMEEEGRFAIREPNIFLLTAWNYADSIKRQHPNFTGTWLAPLPSVRYV